MPRLSKTYAKPEQLYLSSSLTTRDGCKNFDDSLSAKYKNACHLKVSEILFPLEILTFEFKIEINFIRKLETVQFTNSRNNKKIEER